MNHLGIRPDLLDLWRELTLSWTEQSAGFALKSRALLMLIVHRLSEIILSNVDAEGGDYRVSKMLRYIAAHFAEKLTVESLAKQVRIDANYFGRLFRRETGLTVHQYINKIRVEKAEEMLRSGTCKVRDVAELCGFSDTFHFFKLFKAQRGFPPSRCIPKS